MKMTRRVLALLLALCLTFGNVMPAMATGLEGEETVVTEETVPAVPEVEETEAPAEAEEPEAPAEAEETEAPVVETVAEIVDEATNEVAESETSEVIVGVVNLPPDGELVVRDEPSSNGNIVYRLAGGTVVEIYEMVTVDGYRYPWGRISTGWINMAYVTIDGEIPEQPSEPTEPESTEPEVTEPTPDEPAEVLKEGTAYTISAANANGTLWFSGTITSGRFDGTYTESEAVSVYAENVTDGFLLYILDGTAKKYICIADKSAGGSFGTDAATATVFEWNAEKATAAVADDANNRAFGCGATSTYANFSAYDLSGDYNWGQYVVAEGGTTDPEPSEPAPTEPEATEPTEPAPDAPASALQEGVAYNIKAANGTGTLWFSGTITSGRFDGTYTESEAVSVYAENVTDGFLLYILEGGTKQYICIADKAAGGSFGTDAATATVFEWNAEKATAAVADDANNRAFGCGATSTYANFSAYDLSGDYNWGQYVVVEGGTTDPEPSEPAPTEPEATEPSQPETGSSETYAMADLKVDGELGGGEAVRQLGDKVTFTISSGWFNKETRIYKNANGVIASTTGISSLTLNAGYKDSTFNVYTSEDGETWNEYQMGVAYTTAFADVTIDFAAPAKYIKIDCPNAQLRIQSMTFTFSEDGGDVEPPVPESSIDTAAELNEALRAGGTVVMGGDITADVYVEGGDITLDLRGHVLTVSNFCHTVGGKMTIKDSKGTGKIVGQVQNNLGDLTLEGVTVEGCVAAFGGNVIIDGCTIDNKNDIMGGVACSVVAANFVDIGATNPKMVIKNSTVKGAPFTLDSGEVIYMWCLHTQDGGILEIESGNFIGKVQIDSATDVTITGGTFTADISALLGKGYTQNENGEVVKGDPAADSVLTITEALDLGASKAHNVYTEVKYYVTGEITEVYNTKYGNMKIKDEAGNILTVYGTYSADGSTRYDAMDIKPVAGDTVTVYGIIGQFNGTPQLKNGWITEHVPAPGSELNPVMVTFEMNEDYTEGTATVTIPANKTYYFQAYGVGGMELSVNGGEPTLLAGNPRVPSNFTVTNDTAEEAVYTLTVTYPAGSQMNPETLYLGSQYTSLAEGNNQGHFYTYTAENDAVLEFSFAEDVAEGAADIAVTNMNTYAQRSIMWDAVDGVATIEVSAGDELRITVVALPDANWNYPAMDLQWNINYPAGSEQNPEMVQFSMNDDYTEGYATVTIPANTTYYFQAYGIGGMELSVNYEPFMMLPEVMGRMPVRFELTNETAEDATYVLSVAYPAGHQMNPAELMVYTEGDEDVAEGQNVAWVNEGSWNGYTYRWFAPKAGELTITVSNGRAGWSYSITNLNTYAQTDLHSSYDVPNVNAETITVNAGDEIMISVNTCGASYSDVTPAGEVYFTATFAPIVGIEENPLQVEWNWNDARTEATATITVPANTSIFASFTNGGMMLTINDGEPVEITGTGRMPQVLEFKGAEEGETVYNLKMFSPVGSFDNPAELVIGENSCELAENSNGYIYKWTADSDGELTITMGADVESWSYCVNNLTTGVYGDTYSSTDEEIVSSYTVAVAAGDEIQITINTPFSYDTWSSPAGTVTFTADFAIPEGAEGNPIFVQFEMDESYMYGNAFVTVPAYTTYYFQSYGIGGMTLEIATEQAENEGWWIVDSFTLPNVMGRQPVVFSVTNDTAEDKEYGLSVSWAMGSQMNPENVTWWYGNTSVELAEGDTDGYYYTHTAPVTGPVEFFLHDAMNFETGEGIAADIIVTNMNTYEQKVMSYDGVDGVMTMDVTEGDELQIIVTAQPDENWEYPAAYINWGYGYIEGTEGNPTWMELGKTNVKIEAGDEDGYYLVGTVEETGYLTITMNSSNWEYKVGKRTDVFGDNGEWLGTEIVWSDLQASNAGGAKSQTIYFDHSYGENYYLYINTANKKAGTVTFTATLASKLVDLTAGQTATLTFTDPATGMTIADTSNAVWEIYYMEENGKEVSYENFGDYATVENGKLTAAAGIESEVKVYVAAVLKTEDSAIENHYEVYIRPAASSIQINKGHVEEIYTDNGYMENWVTEEENVTELTYVVNGNDRDFNLTALVGPETALQDVTWKSSNTKILDVGTYNTWTENGKMQVVYLNSVFNPKTGKVGTGTVTLTATANDGSGVKATVNVNVVLETKEIHIYPKNDQWQIVPGKSATMMAEVYTWYNQAPTNDDITWEIAETNVFDFENYQWLPYEGDAIATISDKGLVKTVSGLKMPYQLVIRATAEDTGLAGETYFYIAPPAKKGVVENVPETYDVNSGEMILPEPEAYFSDAYGNEAFTGYTWNSSNKNVAEFIWVIDYEDEYGSTYGHYELQFTGKTGKVTLTATATDGSRAKATWTINVTKAPNVIEMIEEASVAAGATLTLKATPAFESYDWETDTPIYDYAVSDKTILWDAKVVEWNEDMWEWVEVEQDIGLKISNGKLSTNAKKITGTEPITVKVTATAKLGVYDSMFDETNCASAACIVTVYPATKQVDLVKSGEIVSKKTLTVEESNYIVLDAKGAPVGEYIWTSSNEKVAIVENNADGSVTIRSAGKMGKATITATANDGTKKSAKVTVNFVKAVEEIYFPEDLFLSVAKGKSVNFSKIAVVGPTDASNKKLTWSMEWVAFDEATGEYVTKGDGIVPKTVATMSNGSVKAVMKNVTDFEYVRITATAADKFGASCEAIVVLAPNAIKGVELYIVDEAGEIDSTNYAKKSYATTDSQVVLRAVATNGPDDLIASGLTLTSSNKNFEVVWGEMGIVVRPVKDAVNPYGKVKVTMKTTDGGNVSTDITIVFKQPEA